MKRRILRAAVSACAVLLLVGAGLSVLTRVTRRGESEAKYRPFFEDDTEYDVLFFGTSHVMNGVYPMQLWREYGITSYNFGGAANSLAMSYWVMTGAIDEHKPKVAVLDVLYAGADSPGMDVGVAHQSMDVWPLSVDKIRAVYDMFPDEPGERMELLFPFSVYHSRWSELTGEDIERALGGGAEDTKEKGAQMQIAVCEPWAMTLAPQDAYKAETSVGLAYIQRFIDHCRQNGVQPVIVNIPYPADEESQLWANAAIRLAREQGVPTLNLQYGDVVDFDTDCYDPGSHLNPSGARKVTRVLGGFLADGFGLTDKRDDARFASWWEDEAQYRELEHAGFLQHDDLRVTLMLLYGGEYTAELVTTDAYEPDEVERKLIAQLGDGIAVSKAASIASERGERADIRLTVRDAASGEVIVTRYYAQDRQITAVQ